MPQFRWDEVPEPDRVGSSSDSFLVLSEDGAGCSQSVPTSVESFLNLFRILLADGILPPRSKMRLYRTVFCAIGWVLGMGFGCGIS